MLSYDDIKAMKAQAADDLKKFKAVLFLKEFEVKAVHELVNGYHGWTEVAVPWYLFETDVGLITMGWRKRVINVDWSSTDLRWERPVDPDVTRGETFFHAWGYDKLHEYMRLLRKAFLDKKAQTL